MNRHIVALIALSGFACSSFAGVLGIDWYSNPPTNFFQPGGSLAISSSYTFELGVFSSTPAWSSSTDISSKFVSIGASAPYTIDGGGNYAYISTTYTDVGGAANSALLSPALGNQLYLIAFNNSSVSTASQLFVATNSSWIVPGTFPTATDGVTYQFEDVGTSVLFGSLSGNSALFATAVPEPATYAAILGLVTLGLVGYRRFRRS